MPTSTAPRPSPIHIPTVQRLPSTLAGAPVNSVRKSILPERARSPGVRSAPSRTFRPSAPIPKTQKLLSNADRKPVSSYVSKVYAIFSPKHATVEHIVQPQNGTLESTEDWLKDEIEFEEYLPSGDRTLRQEDAFLSPHFMMINFSVFRDEMTPAKFTVPVMQITLHNTCWRISPETGEEEFNQRSFTHQSPYRPEACRHWGYDVLIAQYIHAPETEHEEIPRHLSNFRSLQRTLATLYVDVPRYQIAVKHQAFRKSLGRGGLAMGDGGRHSQGRERNENEQKRPVEF
ncbi:hypothetical protein ARMGADRAFT_1080036 [Armillaria gallica]|uniref:Uncharacterized protein n=1 Tax=Armillaria gallica TaxID=47427 RepID=A0A2H3DUM3_ARMGA|nr:hypothetical protein ARMGADRAFT_1080036 [Armillaria gallica]